VSSDDSDSIYWNNGHRINKFMFMVMVQVCGMVRIMVRGMDRVRVLVKFMVMVRVVDNVKLRSKPMRVGRKILKENVTVPMTGVLFSTTITVSESWSNSMILSASYKDDMPESWPFCSQSWEAGWTYSHATNRNRIR
jgi:hypothetical protein